MANELLLRESAYVVFYNPENQLQVWNVDTSAWESILTADFDDCVTELTEIGTTSNFVADLPSGLDSTEEYQIGIYPTSATDFSDDLGYLASYEVNTAVTQLGGPVSITIHYEDADGNEVGNVFFTIVGEGTSVSDSNGLAEFGVDAGEYTIVSKATSGIIFPNTTLDTSSTTEITITGTATVIPEPVDPSLSQGYLYTYDAFNALDGEIRIDFRILETEFEEGESWSTQSYAKWSDSDGLLTAEFRVSSRYEGRRGNGSWVEFTTPASGTFALPLILGAP